MVGSNSFQSTLPREERRLPSTKSSCRRNFNPRSHERSDVVVLKFLHLVDDFNPRSHERSDSPSLASCAMFASFQSTLPREERLGAAATVYQKLDISIHAPTRGATLTGGKLTAIKEFQSTLPREERRSTYPNSTLRAEFQSTLPREERQQYCTKNLFIFIQYRQ